MPLGRKQRVVERKPVLGCRREAGNVPYYGPAGFTDYLWPVFYGIYAFHTGKTFVGFGDGILFVEVYIIPEVKPGLPRPRLEHSRIRKGPFHLRHFQCRYLAGNGYGRGFRIFLKFRRQGFGDFHPYYAAFEAGSGYFHSVSLDISLCLVCLFAASCGKDD